MSYAGPTLDLLAAAATTPTAATVAAANIQTRVKSAFNQLVQAWSAARTKMWDAGTDPQDIADALGAYGMKWFDLFDDAKVFMNKYMAVAEALPSFVAAGYTVTDESSSGNTTGYVTIGGSGV